MDPVTVAKTAQLVVTLARSRTVRVVVVTCVLLQGTLLVGLALIPADLAAVTAGQSAKRAAGDDGCDLGLGDPPRSVRVRGFDRDQVGNARIIWSVGRRLGMGDRAGVIGIATALQESTLRNLGWGDGDSVGLFQQRAGWGPRAIRMDPDASATLFYRALARIPGWDRLPLTVAAQRVQISAFPTAYAKHEPAAQALVDKFTGGQLAGDLELGGSGLCAGDAGAGGLSCPATGWGVEQGLTPDALRVLRCVHHRWPQVRSFGGVGDRAGNPDTDHQAGRAVDITIPDHTTPAGHALGDQIAAWARVNAARLGVTYVIWQSRIWSTQRRTEGWRTCGTPKASCYAGADDTAAHRDHVHVSVNGNAAGVAGGSPVAGVVRPLTSYTLTARFGQCSSRWRACHTGLDFAAPTGRPVRAVAAGTVTYVGWGGAYGRLTKIRHRNGSQSWYAHQSGQTVRVGQRVIAGQSIGRVGSSGNTTGPHLHLEIRIGGRPVDPAVWLAGRGARP